MKAAIQSVVGGFLLGSLPFWLSKIHWEPPRWLAAVEEVTTFLLLPGLLVALVVARGRYDDINIVVAVIASCFFYSGSFYFLARRRKRASPQR